MRRYFNLIPAVLEIPFRVTGGAAPTAVPHPPQWRSHRSGASTEVARPAGLEPATPGLEGRCSIRLSYGRNRTGRGGGIRTPDPLLPKQLRYQAALHPDVLLNCKPPLISTSTAGRKKRCFGGGGFAAGKEAPAETQNLALPGCATPRRS